jgi:hypothetical protein
MQSSVVSQSKIQNPVGRQLSVVRQSKIQNLKFKIPRGAGALDSASGFEYGK